MLMPEVASFEGIKILFYHDDHPPPHFHARYAENEAMIDIETGDIIEGWLPRAQFRKVKIWAAPRRTELRLAWMMCESDLVPEKIK